jgi:hypothetical protein
MAEIIKQFVFVLSVTMKKNGASSGILKIWISGVISLNSSICSFVELAEKPPQDLATLSGENPITNPQTIY